MRRKSMEEYVVLVCGDRNWKDQDRIYGELFFFHHKEQPIDRIISGGAKGVDSMTKEVAKMLDIPFKEYPAEWEEYKAKYPAKEFGNKWKSAGNDRNQQMLDEGNPDIILAFHSDIANSKGTWDMIKRANEIGIEVRLIAV